MLTVYYVKVHESDTIHEYLRLSMDSIGYCLVGRCSGDTSDDETDARVHMYVSANRHVIHGSSVPSPSGLSET